MLKKRIFKILLLIAFAHFSLELFIVLRFFLGNSPHEFLIVSPIALAWVTFYSLVFCLLGLKKLRKAS